MNQNVSDVIPHAVVLDLKQRIASRGLGAVRKEIARAISAGQNANAGFSAMARADGILRRVQSFKLSEEGAVLRLAVPFLVVANSDTADGYAYPHIPGLIRLARPRALAALLGAPGADDVELRVHRAAFAPQVIWQRLQQDKFAAPQPRKPADGDNFMHTGECGGASSIAIRLILVDARLRGADATERVQQVFGSSRAMSTLNWSELLDWGRREFQSLGLVDLVPAFGPVGDLCLEVAAYLNGVTLDLLADAARMTSRQAPYLARARSREEDWSHAAAHTRGSTREEIRVAAYADYREQAEARICLGSGLTADDVDRALAMHAARYQPIDSDLPPSALLPSKSDTAGPADWLVGRA